MERSNVCNARMVFRGCTSHFHATLASKALILQNVTPLVLLRAFDSYFESIEC